MAKRPSAGELFSAPRREPMRATATPGEKPARLPDDPGVYTCLSCGAKHLFRNPIPAGVNCTSCWFRDGRLIPCLWTPTP